MSEGHVDLRNAIDSDYDPGSTGGDGAGDYTPPEKGATVQPPSVEPPALAYKTRILDRFKREIRGCGLVGEERNAATLYLILTSRLLDKQVSAGVKGHSASGKSYTVETVVRFFPADEVIEFTAMSERALVYTKQEFKHRTLVIYEVVALREGIEDNLTAYFVRSLLSEGQIKYETTVRDKEEGGWTAKTITKDGPTNLVFTTTQTRVHAENETRVLSLNTDDSRAQTARVLLELANEGNGRPSVDEWHQLQRWLAGANHRVTIPYAPSLAELVAPVAIRLRRDFGAVLALIRSSAVLHQLNRDRDAEGRIIATYEDYEIVRDHIADVLAAGVETTVPPTVRETVAAVRDTACDGGVMARVVAERLNLDKSTASRRLSDAADAGYVHNLEDRRGKPGRWVLGDPMPEDQDLLPQPRNLAERVTASQAGGCAVAGVSGGIKKRLDDPHESDTAEEGATEGGTGWLFAPDDACVRCGAWATTTLAGSGPSCADCDDPFDDYEPHELEDDGARVARADVAELVEVYAMAEPTSGSRRFMGPDGGR